MGDNIERLRDTRGWSQVELADRLRMRQPSAWKLEQGKNPELRTLFKLAKALECSIEELVTGVDEDYDRTVAAIDESATARVRTGEAGERDSPVQFVLRQLAHHEDPSMESARAFLERIHAKLADPYFDLGAFIERLPGGQTPVDRGSAPGGAARARKNSRSSDRPDSKKSPARRRAGLKDTP